MARTAGRRTTDGTTHPVRQEPRDLQLFVVTRRTFREWVEPIALTLRQGRAEVAELARSIPETAWRRPSPNGGWTYKDLLAHLAIGDIGCQMFVRAALADEPLEVTAIKERVDDINECYRRELADHSVEELIARLEAEGEETQRLLASLTDAHEKRRFEDAPMSLGGHLRHFHIHDETHVLQLRGALEEKS